MLTYYHYNHYAPFNTDEANGAGHGSWTPTSPWMTPTPHTYTYTITCKEKQSED
jgi:hypothetical protein